jgi:two-component system, OmpR family, sensor histidine kinase KdpD
MSEVRPDPDALLARVQAQEAKEQRGRLKVFFGAAAGVGKTYAMLEAAQALRAQGVDVVAGYVETHDRAETEALLRGLELLPQRSADYRGVKLREFDLDGALARRPALLLVDELAHTNAPGSRHTKRWQDVLELLTAGISVYTTVNVQHLESLNDVITQITSIVVRETVPDSVVEQADEIELVDLSPDELLQRLREGKVYFPGQAEQAMRSFFRKGNLMALRELALRRTADRVDQQMLEYRRDHAVPHTWPTKEHLLVCVSPGPLGSRLVRAGRRMAASLGADWVVVHVETPEHARLSDRDRLDIERTLQLAEQLGAHTAILSGASIADEVLAYARAHNVSKIIIGKPLHPYWRERLFGSVVDEVVDRSGEVDVYVITGDPDLGRRAPVRLAPGRFSWLAYVWATLIVAVCTTFSLAVLIQLDPAQIIMVYLVGVVVVAVRLGRGPSALASVLAVVAFDFFFVPPQMTLAVGDTQYVLTMAIMLVVALIISNLATRTQQQAAAARRREQRTAALYALSREFAIQRGLEALARTAQVHISEALESEVAILVPDAIGRLIQRLGDHLPFASEPKEEAVAQWAFEHREMAGLDTDTLPGAQALYVPLATAQRTVGVLAVRPQRRGQFVNPEQLHLLEAMASQTALAFERATLTEDAERAQVQIEAEHLRNALLSSVSHDLRTPLATITGAASSLLEDEERLEASTRRELAQSIYDEAELLSRVLRNLLDMTRLQSGSVTAHKEWQPLEEVIGAALTRMEEPLRQRPLSTSLPAELPPVPLDGVLIEQVLVNLLENALKYTPTGSPVTISAWQEANQVLVEVADRGPGIPAGEEEAIFEKFHRAPGSCASGVGLGLAISRGIVSAHGGRIWAANRPGGGAAFRFTLPLTGDTPMTPPTHEAAPTAKSEGNHG